MPVTYKRKISSASLRVVAITMIAIQISTMLAKIDAYFIRYHYISNYWYFTERLGILTPVTLVLTRKHNTGVWRSWLARAVWDREVEGSSPFTPTSKYFR